MVGPGKTKTQELLQTGQIPSYRIKSEMPHGTVQNTLTKLRKRALVEYTGEVEPHTNSHEVRLTKDGLSVTA
jgi:hypothetical protein